jgi:hypothetical protein
MLEWFNTYLGPDGDGPSYPAQAKPGSPAALISAMQSMNDRVHDNDRCSILSNLHLASSLNC